MAFKVFKIIPNAFILDENTSVDFAEGISDENEIISEDSDCSYLRNIENENMERKACSNKTCSSKKKTSDSKKFAESSDNLKGKSKFFKKKELKLNIKWEDGRYKIFILRNLVNWPFFWYFFGPKLSPKSSYSYNQLLLCKMFDKFVPVICDGFIKFLGIVYSIKT